MVDEEAARWVVRMDRGLTAEEQAALDAWIGDDDRRRGALVRAQAAWTMLDRAQVLGAPEAAAPSAARLKRGSADWTRRRFWRVGGAVAAALAIAATLTTTPWSAGEAYATTTGEVRRLPLEDGSLAVINSDSAIRVEFHRNRREVELSRGEAWFKVARNPERPFRVAAGPVQVEAVGTAFDVRRHDGFTEVIVTEGVVKIRSREAGGEDALVRAGGRALIDERRGIRTGRMSAAALAQHLAWQEGRIVLDDMTLAAAAAEFNRYNTIKLEVAPALADEKLVGWFRFDDLESFVRSAATLVGGKVEREEKTIRIVK